MIRLTQSCGYKYNDSKIMHLCIHCYIYLLGTAVHERYSCVYKNKHALSPRVELRALLISSVYTDSQHTQNDMLVGCIFDGGTATCNHSHSRYNYLILCAS